MALIHTDQPGSAIYRPDIVGAEDGMTLRFAKDLFEQARHPLAATIKHRRRDDTGDQCLCSGCASCDAMYDPYDLADVLDAGQGEIGSLPVLAGGSRTTAEWAMLFELPQTSGFDED